MWLNTPKLAALVRDKINSINVFHSIRTGIIFLGLPLPLFLGGSVVARWSTTFLFGGGEATGGTGTTWPGLHLQHQVQAHLLQGGADQAHRCPHRPRPCLVARCPPPRRSLWTKWQNIQVPWACPCWSSAAAPLASWSPKEVQQREGAPRLQHLRLRKATINFHFFFRPKSCILHHKRPVPQNKCRGQVSSLSPQLLQ